MPAAWKAAALLVGSNVFVTVAWHGHGRFVSRPMGVATVGSWGIALVEWGLQGLANRFGHHVLSAYQLKVMREAITLVVFAIFSWVALGTRLTPRHAVFCALIFVAVAIRFRR